MDTLTTNSKVVPFSLKDAPSLIERVWPAQKISVEAQKERKANIGQTLTVLGAYWKGRKPLVLVRACILASLLPSTNNPERDVRTFEALMGFDDNAFLLREQALKPGEIARILAGAGAVSDSELRDAFLVRKRLVSDELRWEDALRDGKLSWAIPANDERRKEFRRRALQHLPYAEKVNISSRPEEVGDEILLKDVWRDVNRHLGTNAYNIHDLVEQLGIMRFGRRPRIADTFSGGCSIPFEAARLGCDAYASDLNPVACMLSWGAFNLLGATRSQVGEISAAQDRAIGAVDEVIRKWETDAEGNRAKAYIYCLEVTCPQTGWVVPLVPNLIVSTDRRVVGVLRASHDTKRFEIDIVQISKEDWDAAAKIASRGTVKSGNLVYELDGEAISVSLKSIRGDYRDSSGEIKNRLRLLGANEIGPKPDDIFRERLYCIHWMKEDTLRDARQQTYFAAPTAEDLQREEEVQNFVASNLKSWQQAGFVPDMRIEQGEKTDEPIRTRGWSFWHHLFSPRQLMMLALIKEQIQQCESEFVKGALTIAFARSLDRMAKLCQWSATPAQDIPLRVFVNQALNTLFNWGVRADGSYFNTFRLDLEREHLLAAQTHVQNIAASHFDVETDVFVTDPPYADAVNYHEITEFFIAWLRKAPPIQFESWTWDSRRSIAIKGDGQEFRTNMISAYGTMTDLLPENGLQIVMFTHQSTSVWADMAQIFWGAGLRVMAAWYIATETTSELKKGGYVQGTVILVLRKRAADEHGYKDEIVQEVKVEVAEQIDTMAGLNQQLKGHGRVENLFEDADLQMAGYAAALRVLTRYSTIDGIDMAKEATRSQAKGERTLVGEIIDFAVQVANEHMVPEGMNPKTWENLTGAERFYFKMMDVETTGAKKLDNYQNFAKAFRVSSYDDLMGNMEPNKARLKTAKDFKKAGFEIKEFGSSKSRALLYAIWEMERDIDGDEVLSHLRDQVERYYDSREDLMALADYIAVKREHVDDEEARAARIVHGLIRNERFG